MADDVMFSIDEANQAQKALREAAGLGPARFSVPAVVGMLSDEIEALRKAGRSDDEIADVIAAASGKSVAGDAIGKHYAPPKERHPSD